MNPSLICETKIFNLSTRSSGCTILNSNPDYKSICEYFIPDMITRDDDTEYIQFSLPTAVIPVSFYNVSENNNTLQVVILGIITTYTIKPANYTANSFITAFGILLGSSFKLSLDQTTNFFTITKSDGPFTILGISTLSSVMGFSSDLSSSLNSNTISLTRCCNFLPLPRVTMRCVELSNSCMVGQNNSNDVIMSIPNNSKSNGQLYFQNQTKIKTLFRHNELSRFIISFTDDDNNPLHFHGISSFFTIQFDIYRRWTPNPPKFSEIVRTVNSRILDEDE